MIANATEFPTGAADVAFFPPSPTLPKEIDLKLVVREPETVAELCRHPEGTARNTFSLSALRLGVLALRQAGGFIDSAAMRQEGDRLVGSMRELLTQRCGEMTAGVASTLKQYLDPATGQLPQRLERLLKKDGELESLLGRHLDGDTSVLAQTLARHVGQDSPVLRLLSPDQSDGVIAALAETLQAALDQHREQILRQFSLDNADSALARLLGQLTDANGRFRADLAQDLSKVCGEFSLDNADGALSRLVRRVELAQRSIVEQFSNDNENSALRRMSKLLETTNEQVRASLTLDDEKSPLARLRRELMQVLKDQEQSNAAFRTDVRGAVEALKAHRAAADRSTLHGGEFEDAVGAILQDEAQRLGDIYESVGKKTGARPPSKVGDYVITLNPDSAAPGARIVCEAKANKSCDLARAQVEIEAARYNRSAQVGIFVFSADIVPQGTEPLARVGSDLFVVWDREDRCTDVYLKAALSIARALVVRQQRASEAAEADFAQIEAAVDRIAGGAKALKEIEGWAAAIKTNGQKIFDKSEKLREDLEKQVDRLQDHLGQLKKEIAGGAAQG